MPLPDLNRARPVGSGKLVAAVRCAGLLACLAGAPGCADTNDASGRPCQTDSDCGELACRPDPSAALDDLEPLPLICAPDEQGRAFGAACTRGSHCGSGLCALAGACVVACAEDADCSAARRCQSVFARGEQGHLHPLLACVARVDLPDDARVQSEVLSDAFDGTTGELALPPIERASLFVIEHLDDSTWPTPAADTSCRPPLCGLALERPGDARSLFDRATLADDPDGPDNPVAIGDHVNPLTVLAPNGPRSEPSSSGYRLRIESKLEGRARITMLQRAPSGGRLDLNVFVLGVDALAAPDSTALADALEEVDRIFEPAGIFVGDVRQIAVESALVDEGVALPNAEASRGFAHLAQQYGVYPQLPELFKLSAGAGNPAVDVFFVQSFDPQPEGVLGGIAGATPLPLGMHGTAGSGVAIAALAFSDSSRALGRALRARARSRARPVPHHRDLGPRARAAARHARVRARARPYGRWALGRGMRRPSRGQPDVPQHGRQRLRAHARSAPRARRVADPAVSQVFDPLDQHVLVLVLGMTSTSTSRTVLSASRVGLDPP